LADAPLGLSVQIDDKNKNIILLHRNKYKSIEELSETELRLTGLLINPVANICSRTAYYNNVTLMKVGRQNETSGSVLPMV